MSLLPFEEDGATSAGTGAARDTLAYKVLVVDDEEIVRDVLSTLLGREQDLAIHTAETAEAALSLIDREHFHVLITDKNLPGMGGIDLIREARSRRDALEAIMITGYASAESVIAAFAAGASDYLLKPFENLHVVRAKVRAAVERRNAQLHNREAARNIAREASTLLDEGKDAPEPAWKKLEATFQAYEKAIREGASGAVAVVGSEALVSVLTANGLSARAIEPAQATRARAEVIVIETGSAEWRANAEKVRAAGEVDVILAARPGADLEDLLEAIGLHVPLAGFGGHSETIPQQVKAVLQRRSAERAQMGLVTALAEFKNALGREPSLPAPQPKAPPAPPRT